MREMGIQAIYPRQNTSKSEPSNPIYPYLLKGLKIIQPNQVWSIKYEDIYLNEYNAPLDARIGIARYIHFYNTERPHSCLRYHTPESVYYSVT